MELLTLSSGKMRVSRENSCSSFADPKTVKILVVEDNVMNQKVLRQLLKHIGYTCEVANNGNEAVELFLNGKTYAIVLLDIMMPGANSP
jgi:CheY-like chemotaxis protein